MFVLARVSGVMSNLRSTSFLYTYTNAWLQTNLLAARFTASNQIRVFFPTIKPRIFSFLLFYKNAFCKQREKVCHFLLLLGMALDVIIFAFDNKTFLLPWEYEKSSENVSMFLPSLFATKLIVYIF